MRTFFYPTLFFAPGTVLAAGEQVAPSPVGGVLQVILALGFVLALIGGLAWALRRMGAVPQAAGGALRVVGGIAVGQRERVVVVQVGETQMVVGVAPGEVRMLHVLEKPIVALPVAGFVGGDFAQRLATALRRGGHGS